MPKEIKVVIVLKDTHGTVGIQSPECDPVFSTVEGDIVSISAELPALVQLAEQKWATNPKNPKAPIIEPPPATVPAGSATGGGSKSKTIVEQPPKETQPAWFP